MKTFSFVYGAILGEIILRHADNLSNTLQHKSMSAAEGQQVALMTVQTMNSIRTEESFDLFRLIDSLKIMMFPNQSYLNKETTKAI